MKLLYSDLVLKKVFTESGEFVGYVNNITFDINSYTIISLYISKKIFWIFFYNTILIDILSIISITKNKIIIKDSTEKTSVFNDNKKISHQLDVST